MPGYSAERSPEFSLGLHVDLSLQHTEGLNTEEGSGINHLLHGRGRRRRDLASTCSVGEEAAHPWEECCVSE